MKHIALIVVMLMASLSFIGNIRADETKGVEREVNGLVISAATGKPISDTIYVELMTPDSLVVGRCMTQRDHRRSYSEPTYWFDLKFTAPGNDFILKLFSPDYAAVYKHLKIKNYSTDAGTLQLRKLTRFEKGMQLGEVNVTASVIQVVNKGDTIQYNADAFAVAQGSMLDALVEQLPGVELRDNGQIFVNGRFVDKLLLDGKDFFKGNQFVLLQNLPAYTVKNVKVYEQLSNTNEVFGKGVSRDDPDLYVMDINLKKGYNNGIIANAEVGVGTHSRYRGRAFGLLFNKSVRLGAFAMINNINEKRRPGSDGDWDPADGTSGLTTTKSGGLDYGYFKPDRSVTLNGSVTAQYNKTNLNQLTNTQNFLAGGNTFTRRWNDNKDRDVNINTDHTFTFRPKSGNAFNETLMLNAFYGTNKSSVNTTEGTFNRNPGEVPSLRSQLENGWVDDMDAINRYLELRSSGQKSFGFGLNNFTVLSLPWKIDGFRLIGSLDMHRSDDNQLNTNDYLLQYAGQDPTVMLRSNPQKAHGYKYILAFDITKQVTKRFQVALRVDYFQIYEFKSNTWLTDNGNSSDGNTGQMMLPSMRAETMMRLDPRNSYFTGLHENNLRPRLSLFYNYEKRDEDGMLNSDVGLAVDVDANIQQAWIDYTGLTNARAGKNFTSPRIRSVLWWNTPGMKTKWQISYDLTMPTDLNPFDMLDITLDSDPLNIRTGNPDLTWALGHSFGFMGFSKNWLWNRFMFSCGLNYEIDRRMPAMSYSYDRATGVRTYRPVNVNGNRHGYFYVNPTIALNRAQTFRLSFTPMIMPRRSVDMISLNEFESTQESVVKSMNFSFNGTLSYSVKRFMVAADGKVETQRSTSEQDYFTPFRVTKFNYGVRGRVKLPWDVEVSTDLKMYSTRGFDYAEMNTNQLVWNARLTKSFLKGMMLFSVDGYDMLGRVKNITYRVNEQGRTETWVNNIPSYVMFSLRWNFSKSPRE